MLSSSGVALAKEESNSLVRSGDRAGSTCVDCAADCAVDCAVDCAACAVSMQPHLRGRRYTRRRRHARWGHANVDLEDGDGGEVDGGGKFFRGPRRRRD